MDIAKNFLKSPLVHFSLAAVSGTSLLTAGVIILSTSTVILTGALLLVASAIAFIFAACQISFREVAFYAELSQFQTNYCQFKIKNLTPDQTKGYHMGVKPCYYHVVDKSPTALLFQGAQPSHTFNHDKTLINDHNIKTVINLTEEEESKDTLFSRPINKEHWNSLGIKTHHKPIKDFTLPTVDFLKEAVSKLSRALTSGNVYLHCMSGVGRSSCVTLAWYIHQYEWTLGKAKEILYHRRASVNIDKEKINQLMWDFIISHSKNPSYTLLDEIQRRFHDLCQTNPEEAIAQIQNEYKGISGLEEALKELKVKNT